MAIHKILDRIQEQINDLAPTLELFVHDNIQASVEDCEKLQKQLIRLQEDLAIYKYNKLNHELSPSFNIHAKLSQQEIKEEKKESLVEEIKSTIKIEAEEKAAVSEIVPEPFKVITPNEPEKEILISEPVQKETAAPLAKSENTLPKNALIIGLNDKFRFLNELFAQNSLEYNIAIEQLNNLMNWGDTEIYLNSLKTLYGWKDSNEAAKLLFTLSKQRFT